MALNNTYEPAHDFGDFITAKAQVSLLYPARLSQEPSLLTFIQVLVVSSYLQLKWEQAQIDFGLTLTSILLEYWDNRWKSITDEIKVISDLIKETTEESEIEFMTTIISRITTNVERDLSTKKTPNQSQPTKN